MVKEYETLYEFRGDQCALFAKMHELKMEGYAGVWFRNEDIRIDFTKETDVTESVTTNMLIVIYNLLWNSPDILKHYADALLLLKEKN